MDFEKEEAISASLATTSSPASALIVEGNDITAKIVKEDDPNKLEDLTQLFNINQKKKDICRANRLSNLLELIDDEAISRLSLYPDAIDNSDLINYMRTTQQAITNTTQSINQTPLIQINNTKTEVNVNTNTSGLSRESRAKVLEVVNAILCDAKKSDEDIIDVTPN